MAVVVLPGFHWKSTDMIGNQSHFLYLQLQLYILLLFAFSRLSQRPTAKELEDKHILLSTL